MESLFRHIDRPVSQAAPRRKTRRLLAVVAALLLVFPCLTACDKSPYDWSGLTGSHGRLAYYENGELCSQLGIDVAEHQNDIDWRAVARDGIDFAYIRLGWRGNSEGKIYLDTTYEKNIRNARAVGLEVGVYFFSQATTEAEAITEAQFVLSTLHGQYLDLPVVYDFEYTDTNDGRADGISNKQRSRNTEAFCSTIEAGGYTTMVYGNLTDLLGLDRSVTKDRPIWLAEYTSATPMATDFSMWQSTSTGTVAGIVGNVDMNLLFTTAPKPVKAGDAKERP